MRATEREVSIRRVLVAVDASPQSLAALGTAARLAARLHAELQGLFVEDVNLKRLPEIPIVREVRFYSSASRGSQDMGIDLQFRAQADRARRALERIATGAHLSWSFRTARGEVAQEVLHAAREGDLMMMGCVGWSLTGRHLGSTAQEVLTRRKGLTLIHKQRRQRLGPDLPVFLVYDGSPSARKALTVAAQLVEQQTQDLTLVLATPDPEEARQMGDEVSNWLEDRNLKGTLRHQSELSIPALAALTSGAGEVLLVVPGESPVLSADQISGLVNAIHCPVLVVR